MREGLPVWFWMPASLTATAPVVAGGGRGAEVRIAGIRRLR